MAKALSPQSIDFKNIQLFQESWIEYGEQLVNDLYFGRKMAEWGIRQYGNVKGQMVIPYIDFVGDILRRWSVDFLPNIDNLKIDPIVLQTELIAADFLITPTEAEFSAYGTKLRKTGQSMEDNPFSVLLLARAFVKMKQELEIAFWHAKKTNTTAATDKLKVLFDGVIEQIKEAATAGKITPKTLGDFTRANCVEYLRSLYTTISPEAQDLGVDIFMGTNDYNLYRMGYKDTFKENPETVTAVNNANLKGIVFELNTATRILPHPALRHNQIVITPMENMAESFDAEADLTTWEIQKFNRSIKYMGDLRYSSKLMVARPEFLAVTDAFMTA